MRSSTPSPATIRLGTLLQGVRQLVLNDLSHTLKGLVRLILTKPDRIGSIGKTLADQAARYPDRPALAFEGRRWTYRELNEWANRCAWALDAAGIRSGDAVGILLDNRPEVLVFVLGIVKLGAVATLINNQQRGDALAHSLRITRPRLTFVGQECLPALMSLDASERAALCEQWWWDGDEPCPSGLMDARTRLSQSASSNPPHTDLIRLHQPCFHIFTSGTTGLPKASVMSHYRWHRCLAGLGGLGLRLRPDDVLYCPLPLYHNNALTVSWGAAMGAGACLALARKFSASGFWADVQRHQATAFCYIGELCRYLLNQPPSALDRQHSIQRMIGNGLRPDIWDAFSERFGIEHIAEFYTASECNVAFINVLGLPKTTGLCPLSYAVVEVDQETEQARRGRKGHMQRVRTGHSGLLLTEITNRAPLDGYTDSKATDAKVLRDVFSKGDAWFNTGDLVRDQGWHHIQFVDRLGDTFRWKGENVATTEVEGVLSHLPQIEEAVVYGVEVPGADGRAGMAAISLKGESLNGIELAQQLRQHLPRYAVPLFLRVRRSQDVTVTFKYSKVALKKEAYNPSVISDALFVLSPEGYIPMTTALWQALSEGTHRFD